VKAKGKGIMQILIIYLMIGGKSIASSKSLLKGLRELFQFGNVLINSKISLMRLKTMDMIFLIQKDTIGGNKRTKKIQ
jgi:hypothetical protein